MNRHHEVKKWSKKILNFKGYAKVPTFESYRSELLLPEDKNPVKCTNPIGISPVKWRK